jgi:hypothetical protein
MNMKKTMERLVDKFSRRAALWMPFAKKSGASFDIEEIALFQAACEVTEFYNSGLLMAVKCDNSLDLLSRAMEIAPKSGLVLEFGVASGRTINHLGTKTTATIYGFDSFEGLPEAWRAGYDKGAFAGHLPAVPPNVKLIKGWFDDTLPEFLKSVTPKDNVALLHVDCDLYSSTKTILSLLTDRIIPGTVIVFDEYWNYPGWKQHEHRAFEEFIASTGKKFRYDGFVPTSEQLCVVIE